MDLNALLETFSVQDVVALCSAWVAFCVGWVAGR